VLRQLIERLADGEFVYLRSELNLSFFLSFATVRMRSSACDTLFRRCCVCRKLRIGGIHADGIASIDLVLVPMISFLFLILQHARRKLL
jgi:hypothetical protein